MSNQVLKTLMQNYDDITLDNAYILHLAYEMLTEGMTPLEYKNKRNYSKKTNPQRFIELGIARDLYTMTLKQVGAADD